MLPANMTSSDGVGDPSRLPRRYLYWRVMLVFLVVFFFLIAVYYAVVLKTQLDSQLVNAFVGLGPFLILIPASSLFPNEFPRTASIVVCVGVCTLMLNLTSSQWMHRPNQSSLQTTVRQAVMTTQSAIVLGVTAAQIAGLKLHSWTTCRLVVAAIGVPDFLHTTFLHFHYVTWPPTNPSEPSLYLTGRRIGPPSYAVPVMFVTAACCFTHQVRCYISRITGGAQLAFNLGQLTRTELERLVPEMRPAAEQNAPESYDDFVGCPPGGRISNTNSQVSVAQESLASKPWSWSSYGRRWEEDWQEQREAELDAQRTTELASFD